VTVFDTNESRFRHRGAISHGFAVVRDRVYEGYIYTCPRCGFVARPMRHRTGATHRGDRHALDCPNTAHEAQLEQAYGAPRHEWWPPEVLLLLQRDDEVPV
jgi:hypothetical protein